MAHFANAVSKDMDVEIHEVDTVPDLNSVKNLKSMEKRLKELNQKKDLDDTFVAIPALALVPILNIQDQYNKIMQDEIQLTPKNIKDYKQELLSFLKRLYDNPSQYKKYIEYMDPNKQGIEILIPFQG